MFIYTLCYSFLVNIINMPFDKGANIQGSKYAYKNLKNELSFIKTNKVINIKNCDSTFYRNIFNDAFMGCWNALNEDKFPLLIGGDHSCVISSIFASNEFCLMNKHNLGVIWFDAHADFNTIQTSSSRNIHGMPVSVLCGHTLPHLSYGQYLDSQQFIYYGIRDIDSQEFRRFQDYNMKFIDYKSLINYQILELYNWMSNFDKIHVSFDMDCLDPKDFSAINTPVKNGPNYQHIISILQEIKKSNKLISMDLVEYNPMINNNHSAVIDVLKQVF